ncbi:MAG: NAD-dependent DNA ligase LigA, partial [Bacilli bacterium]|nr:NAD-dependent DNA ligase LigA [Bacilli bacterium]
EELVSIPDIGNIIAKSILEFFADEKNQETIKELKEIGLNTKYLGQKIIESIDFSNKTFVLTGSLEIFTREEAKEKIEQLGGKTTDSVSKKTSAVIVGKNPGSKYDKALKLNIPIWSEEEFEKKLKEQNQ